jgi:hypothetical protein
MRSNERGKKRPAKTIPTPENLIHQGIISALTVMAAPGVLYWHPPNEGPDRTAAQTAALKRLGLLPGVPDLVFHLPGGQTAFLEIKRPDGGRLSPEQLIFKDAAIALGCKWALATSIDGALRTLKSWGALRKGVKP